jgi:PDZ domain-containing secreted protein
MARYDGIMNHKSAQAQMKVQASLVALNTTIGISSGKLEQRVQSLEKVLNNASESQGKLQLITIALTIVIAVSTIAYTWITWQTVLVQRESNKIQHEMLNSPASTDSNKSLNQTGANTAPPG